MPQTSMQQIRAWQGPALFSYGFRPFFLFGGLWVVLAMLLWLSALTGAIALPTRFDPVSWHAHEFLFGYLGAVLAGFLLTAVPNWTGRLPIVGWPLAALFALWGAGRIAVLVSALLPDGVAPMLDLGFPLVLGAVILREIVAGKNWHNLIVLALLAVFALANALFHLEAAGSGHAAQGLGLRLGVATAIMMIAVIGGRIIPSFTRNWLARQDSAHRPVPPMQSFDKVVLVLSVAALLLWTALPEARVTAAALVVLGALHLVRLSRWQGLRTGAEPLVWVLHLSYAFIPLGAMAMGLGILTGAAWLAGAQHLWMTGAVGAMTLAVMTRATLGHTGRALHAGGLTLTVYLALFGAAAARLGASEVPALTHVAGGLWLLAFGGFVLGYGPLLLRPKPGAQG
ncbi:NnrS family protein [Tropicibacter oceani]|uniref:NnrS family protein n=1 Tax=Tropicibacter oceani TaxID=3058420 RepID=A0ABY8QMD9_9RHOB|nr:NnrS family protein [Tropicibacter oceani]WGW05623.1 NnrS family protein [Tropicibacter oceani]